MLGPSDVFIFLYSLFWSSALGSAGRYHLFDTAELSVARRRPYALRRLGVGILLFNVVPILYLVAMMLTLEDLAGSRGFVAAAIASFSAFSLVRVAHAIVASNETRSHFYFDEDEWRSIAARWLVVTNDSATYNGLTAHLVPGVLYLVVPPIVPLILVVI